MISMPFITLRSKRQSASTITTDTISRPAMPVKRSARSIFRAKKPRNHSHQPVVTIKEIDDIISLHPLSEYSRYPSESFPRRVKLDMSVSSSESSSLLSDSSRISLASSLLSGPSLACSASSSFLYDSSPSSSASSIYQSDSNPTSSASSFMADSSPTSSAAVFQTDTNPSSPASSISQIDSNTTSSASSFISYSSPVSSSASSFLLLSGSNRSSSSPICVPSAISPKSSIHANSFKDGFRWMIMILLFTIIRVSSEFLFRRH
ncbi:hypothetical protein EV421DRAFT_1789530 [Armillaria borealis]|uniref:Uncharacterized protein n=1 Tax=Armillaria borealis TaxID=47425 RepID=A0AA39MU58_9AGAR|nr:hypothetical protein EV421DRAFT_1789530 [Armillaria borealis]